MPLTPSLHYRHQLYYVMTFNGSWQDAVTYITIPKSGQLSGIDLTVEGISGTGKFILEFSRGGTHTYGSSDLPGPLRVHMGTLSPTLASVANAQNAMSFALDAGDRLYLHGKGVNTESCAINMVLQFT